MSELREIEEATEHAATAVASATRSQTRTILRVILLVLVVAAALWMLYALKSVILLVVLAVFFAYLISPLVEFVHRPFHLRGRKIKIPRALSIGIVYLAIFGSITLVLALLMPRLGDQITQFAQQVPSYLTSARTRAQSLNDFYQRNQLPQAAREAINNGVTSLIEGVGNYTKTGLASVFGWLIYVPWFILIPILGFFFLKDASSFRRSALLMLPQGRWRWRGDEFFQDVNSTLAAYIRAQLTACVLIGSICTIGFAIIGVPYPLVLGIMAGLLEFIPLVGPLTLAVIVALIASFTSVSTALVVLLFLGVLRILEDYVIYPRIIGQGIHLHPLAVILAILAGAELAGIAGIFLAIPVIAIATVSYRHWLEHKGSEGLADLLKPPETAATATAPANPEHPTDQTTPEQMARARPDLLSSELRRTEID